MEESNVLEKLESDLKVHFFEKDKNNNNSNNRDYSSNIPSKPLSSKNTQRPDSISRTLKEFHSELEITSQPAVNN